VSTTYRVPGQYVSIVACGEESYFVLAGAVGDTTWRLLVKGGGAVADMILAAPIGTRLQITGALGRGFPVEEAAGQRLVIAVAGTGIAAALPLATRRLADSDATRTHLYLGLRRASELPFAAEVDAWRAAKMAVTLCVSRESATDAWTERGYVQDVARKHLMHEAEPPRCLLFAVGPAPMVDAMRALAKSLGIPESDVRTNY
jgi:NAD(P)H-flavin reductase